MHNKTIVILYNKPSKNATTDEIDVLAEVNIVSSTLTKLGYDAYEIPFSFKIKKAIKILNRIKPFLVFNLVESIENNGEFVYFSPAVLNHLQIPYTGTPLEAMFVTSNKLLTKNELKRLSINTSKWFTTDQLNNLNPAEKYILKPVWEEGSLGIDENSVFQGNNFDFIEKIKKLNKNNFFVEKYIDGRELNISLLAKNKGVSTLAPAEIKFIDYPAGKPKVLGFKAKWDDDSFESKHTIRTFDFDKNDAQLLEQINLMCIRCWNEFGLKGYARIDFRVDAQNVPYVLEINTNPCISPDSGFYAAAEKSGIKFTEVVQRIINDAL